MKLSLVSGAREILLPAFVLLISLVACPDKANGQQPPQCVDVSGTWDTVANNFVGQIAIGQSGCSISGTIDFILSFPPGPNPIVGTVSGSTITFNRYSSLIACGPGPTPLFQTFTGTVSANGLSISGTFLHPTCGTFPWTATRVTGPPPLSITTSSLPDGNVDTTYTQTLAATGGTPPYTWSASGLPPGLTLNAQTGVITGTPTQAGQFAVGVTVNDSAGASTSAPFSVNIAPLAPTNLSAKQISFSANGIQLSWNYGSNTIDSFSVERIAASANNDWSQAVVVSVLPLTACPLPPVGAGMLNCAYQDLDPTVGNLATYLYRVRAYQGSVPSNYSNTATAYQLKEVSPSGIFSAAIDVDFIPDPAANSLSNAATELRYNHFNWISFLVHEAQCYINGPDTQKLHVYQTPVGIPQQPGAAVLAPFIDPPPGGFFEYGQYSFNGQRLYGAGCPNRNLPAGYTCPGPMDALPYYWNENPTPNVLPQPWYLDPIYGLNPGFDLSRYVNQGGAKDLTFYDLPTLPCISTFSPDYRGFNTILVGIGSPLGTTPPNPVGLASFSWNSTYNGFGGSINGVTVSNVAPPVINGTGGIFNVAPVALGDLPVEIRQMLIQAGVQGVSTAPKVDKDAPMTAAFASGPQGNSGWYTGPVTVTLIATDIDGPSDIAATSYSIDGGSLNAYTSPFTVSSDGIHTIQYGSVDLAGNTETPRPSQTFKIDATPPVITVSGEILPSRHEEDEQRLVRIAISGKITDLTSGVDTTTARFMVTNEDDITQTSGPVVFAADGTYGFTASFRRTRRHRDHDERDWKKYKITVSAKDNAGNLGAVSTLAMVDRDRGDRDSDH